MTADVAVSAIPRPRGESSRFLLKYARALDQIDHWAEVKSAREEGLRRYYAKHGKDKVTTDHLIDQDQEVIIAQVMIDRFTARAAALGPAAILEAQGLLR